MNCKDIQELLSLYLDHELTEQEATEVKNHLKKCSDCRATLELYQLLKDKCDVLKEEREVPKQFHTDLMNKIETLEMPKKKTSFSLNHRVYSAIAAVFAIVFILSIAKPWSYNDTTSNQEHVSMKDMEDTAEESSDATLRMYSTSPPDTNSIYENEENVSIYGTTEENSSSINKDEPNYSSFSTDSDKINEERHFDETIEEKALAKDSGVQSTKVYVEEDPVVAKVNQPPSIYLLLGLGTSLILALCYLIFKRRN